MAPKLARCVIASEEDFGCAGGPRQRAAEFAGDAKCVDMIAIAEDKGPTPDGSDPKAKECSKSQQMAYIR